jgi:hypothetical protein
VRRRDNLRQFLKPMVDRRLLLEHVQRGAANMSRLNRVG